MTEVPDGDEDTMLTTRQAAARLGLSLSTVMRLIYAGELETIRIPPVNPQTRDRSRPKHMIEIAEIKRFKDRNRSRVTP